VALTIGVLGAVCAAVDGRPVELPRPRERSVLAALALAHPRAVEVDALLEVLWGEGGGGTPQTVRSYVSRLRRVLGPQAIASRPDGYALALPAEAIDAERAQQLLAAAEDALAAGDHAAARASALALWRGRPFAELAAALGGAPHVRHAGQDMLPYADGAEEWLADALAFLDADPPVTAPARLLALAATDRPPRAPVVTAHDLPEDALTAARLRLRELGPGARAAVHVGVARAGPPPQGAAVDEALAGLAAAAPGEVARTPAFRAVDDPPG
jgi:hypothetical protein